MSLKYRTSAGTSASDFTDLVVKVGDTLPIGTEVDYDGQSVPAGWQEVSETNLGDVVVDSIRSKNMFNKAEETEKAILNEQHVETTNNQWNTSYYIAVNGSTTYTCSSTLQPGVSANGQFIITEFNSSRVYIKETFLSSGLVQTITTDTNTRFVKICYRNDRQEKIQFELGETNTEYEPYQNLDGHEIFAFKEVKIGTWLSGKPLYRKVFETGVLSTSELSLLTITNEQIKTIKGWLYKDTGVIQPYGQFYNADSAYTSRVFSDGSYVKVQQNTIYQSNNYKARVIIEYTKTTD